MAWRYPLYMIEDGYVVDNVAINENLLSVTEETSGYLNEHNFEARDPTYISRSNLKKGAAMKLAYGTGGPIASNLPHSIINSDGDSVKSTGIISISSTDTYQTFNQDGLSLTFTSRGGPTWICASFTLANTVKYLSDYVNWQAWKSIRSGAPGSVVADEWLPLPKQKGFGFNCALQLDGVILNSSLVGTGDPANEFFNDSTQDVDTSGSVPFIGTKSKAGGGINGAWNAVVLDTIVDLTPGVHTIKVAIMDIRSSNTISYGDEQFTEAYITSREIFALELTR